MKKPDPYEGMVLTIFREGDTVALEMQFNSEYTAVVWAEDVVERFKRGESVSIAFGGASAVRITSEPPRSNQA